MNPRQKVKSRLLIKKSENYLLGRDVTIELKNVLMIRGTLHSVDQYLNIKKNSLTWYDSKFFVIFEFFVLG